MGGYRRQPLEPDENLIKRLIQEDKPELLIDMSEKLGQHLAEIGLKANQIRNIFGTARVIQSNWSNASAESKQATARRKFLLLKPKLAYQAIRNPEVKSLQLWLDVAINAVVGDDKVEEYTRFTRFMEFFEAILAYHAAHGGKQS